jgi:hypothetical protein
VVTMIAISGMYRRMALVITDVSEERIVYIGIHSDDVDDTFLRDVGSNNSHTGSHPRRRHS